MYSRNIRLPQDKSFFLFGPRGVGKSTLVKQRYPQAHYVDLLDSRVYQRLLVDPGKLVDYVPTGDKGYVIIDEVQRVPELLNEVHRLIENEGWRFILTGSSARKLRKKGTNLLAGRARKYRLYPLIAEEMDEDFRLLEAVQYGMMPEVQGLRGREEKRSYLDAYVETYLQEEVMQEGLTRNLAAFARFLQTSSMSVGGVLNVSEVAREAMVERKVVESYFGILEDLMLGVRVPVFTRRAKREMVGHPKFYLFDAGVFRQLRPMGPLDTDSEAAGAALENLVFQHLQAWTGNLVNKYQISYYRTKAGKEVDLVVYGKAGLWAIEVKKGKKFSRSWLGGLKAFGQDYPQAKRLLVYTGKEKLYPEGIEVVPVEELLKGGRERLGIR